MMEFYALWNALRRYWWLVILPVIVAFLVLIPSIPDMLSPSVSYNVVMRFTAAAPSDVADESAETYEDSAYVPWLASEYVVVNLPQWVTSDTFAREVSAELATQNIEIPFEDVRTAFTADSARSIMVVFVNWHDVKETEAIAQAAVMTLQTRNQTYFPQFAAYPAEVVALDDVRVNQTAQSLMTRFSPFLRLGVALAVGIALAVAADYFDNKVRDEDDLTDLGLAFWGNIPA